MQTGTHLKLLFVINPRAGNNNTDWDTVIREHIAGTGHAAFLFTLPYPCHANMVLEKIAEHQPNRVIAVGGDGTLKLVVEAVIDKNILVGLIPGGSANGMARELNIPVYAEKALHIAVNGRHQKIDLIRVNDELCIHLSDIGFNAFVVKTFESFNARGMWGYIKAAWKVAWRNPRMQVAIASDTRFVQRDAAMIVLANATKYGTGATINPEGILDDGLFEIVVIKKIALSEIFKMMISHKPYDPQKTELFKTSGVQVQSKRKVHFQVDGEYLGKIHTIEAKILPGAITMILPDE
jgi:lipid kinase, YegS/Rv2252/BmrU family